MPEMNRNIAKPFLKWAGGKTKLVSEIYNSLPDDFSSYTTYIEPFVGGGSIFFSISQQFNNINNIIINDINKDLIIGYNIIKNNPDELIENLRNLENQYKELNNLECKSDLYYKIRKNFNLRENNDLTQTAYLIFLNKTCFNGLFRVNSKNEFNVPFSKAENPTICDQNNIINVSKLLQKVTILNVDYSETIKYIDNKTLFYFDPPYKPVSKTSSFNSYSKEGFNDEDQVKLKKFCDQLTNLNVKWLLSNSDINFFDNLYANYNIKRVSMKRTINSDSKKRGEISELLIKNY